MEQEVIEQRLKKNGAGWLGYVFLFLLITIAVGTAQKDRGETMEGGDVTYVESAPKPPEQNWVTCELCRGNGRCSMCNGSTAYGRCYSCGNIGVCNMCEGEGRYPENTSYFSVHGSKTGLCGVCLGTGRCTSVGCGVDSPLLGPCNACRGTKVCNVCQGKKYCRNVLDYGVKARE